MLLAASASSAPAKASRSSAPASRATASASSRSSLMSRAGTRRPTASSRLELGGEREQHASASGAADELDAEREAVGREAGRDRDGGLAGVVEGAA